MVEVFEHHLIRLNSKFEIKHSTFKSVGSGVKRTNKCYIIVLRCYGGGGYCMSNGNSESKVYP